MLMHDIGLHIRSRDWLGVVFEIIVVIIGLFMAFQLYRWREQRDHQLKERQYIQRLTVNGWHHLTRR